ncbi:DMT family transporter [Sulfitobacter sp. S190]|uniref:DMT family transporter n=1 Tax=Sulfitobacter sp. S190 TaxID=2867022 RepID=UPI0021A510D8|nr:DMT family transporter [Sulfitobacter sp. S190]UWR22847.1 DMT family transporter [Sulfitobacter sp. S190]
MNDQIKGLLLTALGVLFVVPDSLFVRLIDAPPLTIAFWRLLNSGLLIAVGLLIWQGTAPFRAVLGSGWAGVIYGAGVGLSGLLFVLAVENTSVANVVFIIASMPVFAMLFSRVFLAERISPRMLLTTVAVFAGLAIIAYGSGETEGASWRGDMLALGVSAIFAGALTAARHAKHVSMVAAVPMGHVAMALLILPFATPFAVAVDAVPVLGLHAGFIMLSSIFLALGPRFITSAEVSLLVLGESVFAPLLVWAMLGEDPGRWTLIGGTVVLAALFASNLWVLLRNRRKHPAG